MRVFIRSVVVAGIVAYPHCRRPVRSNNPRIGRRNPSAASACSCRSLPESPSIPSTGRSPMHRHRVHPIRVGQRAIQQHDLVPGRRIAGRDRVHDQPDRDVRRRQLQLRRLGDVRRHGRRHVSVGITLTCTTAGSNKGTVVVNGTTQICANIDSLSVVAAGDHGQQPDRARGHGVRRLDHADLRVDRVGGHVRQRGERHAGLHVPADARHGHYHGDRVARAAPCARRRRRAR